MKNWKGELLCLKSENIKPNFSELSRIYNIDRRTIKKYYLGLINNHKKKKRISKLDKYQKIIKDKLSIPGSNKKAVYMFLKTEVDSNIGSYSNFRKYIQKHNDILTPKVDEIHLRFETEMGKQLQFDWKGPMALYNRHNDKFTFYIFSATLSASRLHIFRYSDFLTLESVERCLIETFEYINGVPEECLTDNMSSIINYDKNEFTLEFKNFAKDMGFIPKKCKIRCPETKGKDESCNRFIKWIYPYNNEFETKEELIEIIQKINEQINMETNQTTNMTPISLFRKEKEYLKPLPNKQIINSYIDTMLPVKVSKELLIYYKGSKYSVPKKYINQTLKVKEIDNKLFIYYNKILVATHNISNKKINYLKSHYIEALKTTLPYKSNDEIEQISNKNLELLGKISKKERGKENE